MLNNIAGLIPKTRPTALWALPLVFLAALAAGCGGSKKPGGTTTAVTTVNVSATLNAPAGGFRQGSAFADWRVLAYATDATTKTGSLAETAPGSGIATLSLALDYGRTYRLLLIRSNTIYATFGYPYTSASGTLTTTTLPLTGTLSSNQFTFGSLTVPASAGGAMVVSAANNPLTKIKTPSGEGYDTAATSPAADTTLAASLNTVFTSTVAAANSLPTSTLPSSGDIGSTTGGGTTCNTTAGSITSVSPATTTPGSVVTISGTSLPTTGAYVGLVSSGTPVTGLGGTQTVTVKKTGCTDVTFTGVVALSGTSSALSFTLPSTAVAGTTGTLVILTVGDIYLSSNTTFTVSASSSTPTDTTAPTITSLTPTAGGSVSSELTTASVTFSEAMTATATPDVTVTLLNPSSGTQTTVINGAAQNTLGAVAWSNGNQTLTFTLTDPRRLTGGTSYQLRLTFGTGANGLKDAAGNTLSLTNAASLGSGITVSGQAVTYTFTTPANPPLVLTVSPANGGVIPASSTTGTITFSRAMNTALTPSLTLALTNETIGTTILSNITSASIGNAVWTNSTTLTFTLTDTRRLNAAQSYSYVLTLDLNTLKDSQGVTLDLAASAANLSGANVLSSNVVQGSFTTN